MRAWIVLLLPSKGISTSPRSRHADLGVRHGIAALVELRVVWASTDANTPSSERPPGTLVHGAAIPNVCSVERVRWGSYVVPPTTSRRGHAHRLMRDHPQSACRSKERARSDETLASRLRNPVHQPWRQGSITPRMVSYLTRILAVSTRHVAVLGAWSTSLGGRQSGPLAFVRGIWYA